MKRFPNNFNFGKTYISSWENLDELTRPAKFMQKVQLSTAAAQNCTERDSFLSLGPQNRHFISVSRLIHCSSKGYQCFKTIETFFSTFDSERFCPS